MSRITIEKARRIVEIDKKLNALEDLVLRLEKRKEEILTKNSDMSRGPEQASQVVTLKGDIDKGLTLLVGSSRLTSDLASELSINKIELSLNLIHSIINTVLNDKRKLSEELQTLTD